MQCALPGEPEPDAVYVEPVSALFDVEGRALLVGILFALLGTYLTIILGDPVTGMLTTASTILVVPRMLLLRRFRRLRARSGRAWPDASTAATWERRYSMGVILFSLFVGALSLRMFEIGTPTLQMLAVAMLFGFASGIVARAAVRPLVCMLSISVAACPTILAAALSSAPHCGVLAIGILAFLLGSFGTIRHAYRAARQHITIAQEMATFARNDPLTGLLNRLGLRQAFAALVPAEGMLLAVHYCDLNRFKPVNDRYGHPAGDDVLAQVAIRLRAGLRPTDLAARIGGDEFVIVQSSARDHDDVTGFVADLHARFNAPYSASGALVRIGASIGTAVTNTPRPDLDRLLSEADAALYGAKQARPADT